MFYGMSEIESNCGIKGASLTDEYFMRHFLKLWNDKCVEKWFWLVYNLERNIIPWHVYSLLRIQLKGLCE